ncbi:outer membrane beta-barrel protein [Shewanella algidipiscicola]|uniref:outer membrane beta-barrel protein n=1 Tax=Shewanella algidipiscicola TaxID=614070 RepID=UPI000D785B1D|nr:outer membrane beta-barrel protein [Shewanella algidipiscicola]
MKAITTTSRYQVSCLLPLLLCLTVPSTPVLGAPVEAEPGMFVAPFGGYSFAATEFDAIELNTQTQSGINISESGHYGIMVGIHTRDPGNVYLLYSHQATELNRRGNVTPKQLTTLDVDYLHVGGSLYFSHGVLRPYITTSLGLTQMRPDNDYGNETRFSMGFGAGIEYQVNPRLSLFTDARAFATFVSSDNALFCDASQCIWQISADIMWQGQVNAGLKLRF